MAGRLWQTCMLIPLVLASSLLAGCKAPPAVVRNNVSIPIPPGLQSANHRAAFATTQPAASRYLAPGQKRIDLTPTKSIFLAFENNPAIRGAYLKYVAEQARYDYIIATWTSTTPGISVRPSWEHSVDVTDQLTNRRAQRAEVFLDRNFLDTSRLRLYGDALNEDDGQAHGYHPSVGGLFRFPLWGSREALQRSSEQIFQQNRLNDAQLEYVKAVREQLTTVGSAFFGILGIRRRAEADQRLVDDLQAVHDRLRGVSRPRTQADLQRLQAEITTASTQLRDRQSNYAIEIEWYKTAVGLPIELEISLVEEPFDPFGEMDHDELLALSTRTDPEIATLANAIKNAEGQLALARKGRLDVAMNLGASSDLRGSGTWTDRREYRTDAFLEVRFIDPRISNNLAREAAADVARYQEAIRSRRNQVYVATAEPIIEVRSLRNTIPIIRDNVERYRRDFAAGGEDYFAGRMNIDTLVQRRRDLFDEEMKLIDANAHLGTELADLAGATGKYFEMLQQPPPPSEPVPGTNAGAASQPASPDPATPSAGCHGPVSAAGGPGLRDSSCEGCHGPVDSAAAGTRAVPLPGTPTHQSSCHGAPGPCSLARVSLATDRPSPHSRGLASRSRP